ncbi:hypothetical protein [Anderseniella sp. Alg231-50]|uniref:hypothetical protein n=1 Tax=Anderseniella sp. Alg231-50 TaxID=1922226 RepID=UPI00307BCB5B
MARVKSGTPTRLTATAVLVLLMAVMFSESTHGQSADSQITAADTSQLPESFVKNLTNQPGTEIDRSPDRESGVIRNLCPGHLSAGL